MPADFKDHFSGHAHDYGKFRPGYPDELFYHLAHITAQQRTAWDCATGNGQSAVILAKYFQQIIASDASENQIRQAPYVKNIKYRVAPAEHSGIEDESIDLITVAQALHWFDLEAFGHEVQRVLVRQGVLAVWTYHLLKINPEIDAIIMHLYSDLLDAYWPAERKIVENKYRDIIFPLTELEAPAFQMQTYWDISQLIGYLNTWSAVKRFEADQGHNPVEMVSEQLSLAWGAPDKNYALDWPLALRLWRKD